MGKAGGQLAQFRTGKEGVQLLGYVRSMSATDWWDMCDGGMPELREVAIRVTSKIPASAGLGRNWSSYGGENKARLKNAMLPPIVPCTASSCSRFACCCKKVKK